jgi:hypothetical protein
MGPPAPALGELHFWSPCEGRGAGSRGRPPARRPPNTHTSPAGGGRAGGRARVSRRSHAPAAALSSGDRVVRPPFGVEHGLIARMRGGECVRVRQLSGGGGRWPSAAEREGADLHAHACPGARPEPPTPAHTRRGRARPRRSSPPNLDSPQVSDPPGRRGGRGVPYRNAAGGRPPAHHWHARPRGLGLRTAPTPLFDWPSTRRPGRVPACARPRSRCDDVEEGSRHPPGWCARGAVGQESGAPGGGARSPGRMRPRVGFPRAARGPGDRAAAVSVGGRQARCIASTCPPGHSAASPLPSAPEQSPALHGPTPSAWPRQARPMPTAARRRSPRLQSGPDGGDRGGDGWRLPTRVVWRGASVCWPGGAAPETGSHAPRRPPARTWPRGRPRGGPPPPPADLFLSSAAPDLGGVEATARRGGLAGPAARIAPGFGSGGRLLNPAAGGGGGGARGAGRLPPGRRSPGPLPHSLSAFFFLLQFPSCKCSPHSRVPWAPHPPPTRPPLPPPTRPPCCAVRPPASPPPCGARCVGGVWEGEGREGRGEGGRHAPCEGHRRGRAPPWHRVAPNSRGARPRSAPTPGNRGQAGRHSPWATEGPPWPPFRGNLGRVWGGEGPPGGRAGGGPRGASRVSYTPREESAPPPALGPPAYPARGGPRAPLTLTASPLMQMHTPPLLNTGRPGPGHLRGGAFFGRSESGEMRFAHAHPRPALDPLPPPTRARRLCPPPARG